MYIRSWTGPGGQPRFKKATVQPNLRLPKWLAILMFYLLHSLFLNAGLIVIFEVKKNQQNQRSHVFDREFHFSRLTMCF